MANDVPMPEMPVRLPTTTPNLPRQSSLSTITVLLPIDDMTVLTEMVAQIRTLIGTIPGSMVDVRFRAGA